MESIPALRVSDWSGTPQRGNTREEYSGKRDPAAPERSHAERRDEPGHAQRPTHNEVLIRVEAHRTTGGDLGNFLMAGLPNASYLGFTGTTIESTDVNTPAVFGNSHPKRRLRLRTKTIAAPWSRSHFTKNRLSC